MSLLQMSISGAILILAIVIIRAIAINRLPKKTFLVLWFIALLRLLIPFSIPSVFSVYSLIGQNTTVNHLGQTTNNNFAPVIQGEPLELTGEMSSVSAIHVSLWFVIWIVGMAFCTAFFAISYVRCRFEFSMSLPVQNDFVEKWLKEHQLMRHISIRQSDRISAPLTYGIFKPVILMPQTTNWKNTKQLQYVLLHEYVHIRRLDVVTKLISTFALCIHWFNPLVWVMYILFNRDIELACDESVVRMFGETSKKDYSLMLINMESKKSGLQTFCNNFSKNAIEERITAIMKNRKTTIFSLSLACIIIVGVTTAFATSAQAEASDSDVSGKNQTVSESFIETATIDEILTSYIDDEGQTRYLINDGNTTTNLSEEEFEQQYPTSDVEWWTYEDYKDWLENEKVQLQSMVGEKAWTSGLGDFVWTQELVEETIAEYEKMLQEIKNGMMYSKTVDGETDIMLGYNPGITSTAYGYQLFMKLDNGDEKFFGPYETANELLTVVKPFCEEQVKLGNMQQSEADEIINRYTVE